MQKSLSRYFPVFVLPTLLAFAMFFVVPFFLGIGLSFTKFTTFTRATWVGLDNYIKAFTADNEFISALGFTALFTIVSIITVNVFAFSLALLCFVLIGTFSRSFFRTTLPEARRADFASPSIAFFTSLLVFIKVTVLLLPAIA